MRGKHVSGTSLRLAANFKGAVQVSMDPAHESERFDSPLDLDSSGRIERVFAGAAAAVLVFSALHNAWRGNWETSAVMVLSAAAIAIAAHFGGPRIRRATLVILALAFVIAISAILFLGDTGMNDTGLLGYAVVAMVAGLLLPMRPFLGVMAAIGVGLVAVGAADMAGLTRNRYPEAVTWGTIVDALVLLAIIGTGSRLTGQALLKALAGARALAMRDSLTGIANRRMFREHVNVALNASPGRGAIIYFDLIGLRKVNDVYGRGAGDEVLVQAAQRLARTSDASTIVGREGSDEFLVGAFDPGLSALRAEELARRLVASLGEPYLIGGRTIALAAGAGVSLHPEHGNDAETLLRNAALALHETRPRVPGRVTLFNAAIDRRRSEALLAEQELRGALAEGRLFLEYQPIVEVSGRALTGFEALLRSKTASGETWAPERFIGVAENSGLIVPLGEWVIDQACARIAAWAAAGIAPVPVSVNVSPRQFLSGTVAEILREAVRRHGISAAMITLELTETALSPKAAPTRNRARCCRR